MTLGPREVGIGVVVVVVQAVRVVRAVGEGEWEEGEEWEEWEAHCGCGLAGLRLWSGGIEVVVGREVGMCEG